MTELSKSPCTTSQVDMQHKYNFQVAISQSLTCNKLDQMLLPRAYLDCKINLSGNHFIDSFIENFPIAFSIFIPSLYSLGQNPTLCQILSAILLHSTRVSHGLRMKSRVQLDLES